MAIVNTAQVAYTSFGNPTVYNKIEATALAGAVAQTTSFTTTNTPLLAQGMTKGAVRIKINTGGGANTAVAVVVTVTDGTNTYAVENAPAYTIANAANSGLDYWVPFVSDISFTQVNVITTLSGTTTTANMDMELMVGP